MEYIINSNGSTENQTYIVTANKTYVSSTSTNDPSPYKFDTQVYVIDQYYQNSECLHKQCGTCNGTGMRKDGLGPCIHMLSCPCPLCSPRC